MVCKHDNARCNQNLNKASFCATLEAVGYENISGKCIIMWSTNRITVQNFYFEFLNNMNSFNMKIFHPVS